MIILDSDRVTSFMRGFARGFDLSPLQLALFVTLVAAFIGLPLFLTLRQAGRSRRARAQRARRAYERRLAGRGLSPAERELLDRLADRLNSGEEPRLLLEHLPVFDAAAARLRDREEVPDAALAALRVKLGLSSADPERAPRSSSELPEGLPVVVFAGGAEPLAGTLLRSGPSALLVRLSADAPVLPVGSGVDVRFGNRAGVFGFSTRVCGHEAGRLELAHAERVRRVQRRRFYRRPVRLAALARAAGSAEPPAPVTLLDLGGGGASLDNAGGRFRLGQDLELELPLPAGEPLRLRAHPVRVSRGGRMLHLSFGELPDAARDRILRFLFRRPE